MNDQVQDAAENTTADSPATPATALARMLQSMVGRGREMLSRSGQASPDGVSRQRQVLALCRQLLQHRGEVSGLALAADILDAYRAMDDSQRLAFFLALAREYDVDREALKLAARDYLDEASEEHLRALNRSGQSQRRRLFERINMAPGATAELVALRGSLRRLLREHPELRAVDRDLQELFSAWFNKGFLELRRIDWSAPALELEKLIAYEAVHEINGWDDLHSRLRDDRRCFAFFHPALAHDPLVFVEVALVDAVPGAIAPLLQQDRERLAPEEADTVVFYSISNCHPGLAGVSFGNFLIKSVVGELKQEMPWLKTFVTLSPVPGFRRWLQDADLSELVSPALAEKVRQPVGRVVEAACSEALMKLCAHYLLKEKSGEQALDPVARFHLGNGARLHQMHWAADLTANGRKQSAGIMVNYLYDLDRIELNHEAYFDHGEISVSRNVSRLLD